MQVKSLTRLAPAKINLFLHIIGKRADGYHDLQTAFQFLDYCDSLCFTLRLDGKILRDDIGPDYTFDLILHSANLLQGYTNSKFGATIKLDKKIPAGGGLGGGSSDAATTLVTLNKLWNTKVSLPELLQLGRELGADVPIFIHGKSAWAAGVGDRISYANFSESPVLVICPDIQVSTKEIFNAKELTANTPRIKIPAFLDDSFKNDFTEIVSAKYPEVAKILEFLRKYSRPILTGSGGCVFARFTKMHEVRGILDIIPARWKAFAARSLNASPLYIDAKINGV